MTVTQAQIEAAGEAMRQECLQIFGTCWSNDVAWKFARTALTAAAEVGEPLTPAIYPSTETAIRSTIERCAQVADKYAIFRNGVKCAAEIRALKEEG